jgi:endo-1,4-beta-xylanase
MSQVLSLPPLVAVVAVLVTGASLPISTSAEPPAVGLKTVARPFFPVGVGVGLRVLENPEERDLLTTHFGDVTPENCMKVQQIQPEEGRFRFDEADRFVELASKHDLRITGHCLVWARDENTPAWFFQDGAVPAGPDLVLSRMRHHIETVAGRYRGRIAMWDVLNEALADGEGEYLRDSGWSRALGEEFLVKAFEYARAADPDALLIYNDYGCETARKRGKLLRLIQFLKSRGAPIDAVGFQGHYELDAVPYQEIDETFRAVRELGLKVVISELDLDVVPRARWWAEGGRHREELASHDPYRDGCPPEVLERQAQQYARLFELFKQHEDAIVRVSFWNLHDGQSWLNRFPWRRVNHPLLFDRQRQPKPAFERVMKVLAE